MFIHNQQYPPINQFLYVLLLSLMEIFKFQIIFN